MCVSPARLAHLPSTSRTSPARCASHTAISAVPAPPLPARPTSAGTRSTAVSSRTTPRAPRTRRPANAGRPSAGNPAVMYRSGAPAVPPGLRRRASVCTCTTSTPSASVSAARASAGAPCGGRQEQDRPLRVPSPVMSSWRSSARLRGATYAAAAARSASRTKLLMTAARVSGGARGTGGWLRVHGTSMTSGSSRLRASTESSMRGRPIRLTRVCFTLGVRQQPRDTHR
jgi:hypothetical protein